MASTLVRKSGLGTQIMLTASGSTLTLSDWKRGMARLAAMALLKDADIDLAPFEARAHWRKFEPEEVLVDFEDQSSDVYFLVAGEVRVLIRP